MSYRVQYTEIKPGGHRAAQDESVRGSLADVRALLDARSVDGRESITVTEYTASDSSGRTVPASEWDVIDDE